MKYRALDPNGDYTFGKRNEFLVDSPEAVGQAVGTRLRLFVGEFFVDTREGLDLAQILGYGTMTTYDPEIKDRILGTPGVLNIDQYSSSVDAVTRRLTIKATINTVYGVTNISEVL